MAANAMHAILKAQLREATSGNGAEARLDIGELFALVSAFYSELDSADTSIHAALTDATASLSVNGQCFDPGVSITQEQRQLFTGTTSTSGIRERFRDLGFNDLRTVLDSIGDMIITVDATGDIQFANRAAVRFFDAARRSLTGEPLTELLPLPAAASLEGALAPYLTTEANAGHSHGEVLVGKHPNGGPMALSLTASPLSDLAAGSFVLCLHDMAQRAEAEAVLRENEERYRALVEHAPEAILVFDVEANTFIDANDNASTLFNLSRRRLLASGFFGLRNPASAGGPEQQRVEQYLQRALDGEQPVFEWVYRSAAGNELPCEVRLSRLPASDRALVRVSVHNIAPRKKRELIESSEKKLLEMIASGMPLDKVLRAICRVGERVLPGARVAVMLADHAGATLHLESAPGLDDADQRRLLSLSLAEPRLSAGVAIATRKPVIISNLTAHRAWQADLAWAQGLGIEAAWSFPVFAADGQPVGTLDAYLGDRREPSTDELDWLTGVARLAELAIGRERARRALSQSEGQFRSLFENVMEGVYIAATNGHLVAANPAMVRMLGYDNETDLLANATRQTAYFNNADATRFIQELEAHGALQHFESSMVKKDGTRVDVVESARLVEYTDGETYIEGTISDITARKQAEQRMFKEKERAEVTLKSIADGVITTDSAGCIEYLNPVAEALTGWSLRMAEGLAVDDVLTLINEHTRELLDNPIVRCLNEGRSMGKAAPCVLIDRSGGEVSIQHTSAPIRDGAGHVSGAVMVLHDAGPEERLSRQLSYQATHDALTGFINRHEFEHVLERAIHRARANRDESYALLYIDLDQFKVVNDTFGHTAGDELIRQLSQRLEQCVRPNDTLARLGGDEFGVLLVASDAANAMRVAEDIRASIECLRFEWQSAVHAVRASIGVVSIDSETNSVTALLGAADVACFAAKDMGRNQVHLYRDGEAGQRHAEMHWLSRINRALDENRFRLYFQPIVHTDTAGKPDYCKHYELLLRMLDEEGELVLPSAFIAAAERYDRMPALDRWVVAEALKHADQGDPDEPAAYTLSINLSGNSLSDDRFLDFVKDRLQAAPLCAGAVCFEITETAAIANLNRVRHFMAELKKLGCLFSLDDFGSGLCSFAYLKNLPVDFIKIDGAFVRGIAGDSFDQSVVGAIQQVGHAMGVETVAEHVEDCDIRQTLASLGVSLMQGFDIARPVSMAEFSPWQTGATEALTVAEA